MCRRMPCGLHPPEDGRTGLQDGGNALHRPVECIDCGQCVPVCPVSAIFAMDELPEKWAQFTQRNSDFYERDAASRNGEPTFTRVIAEHNVFPTGVPAERKNERCVFISHRRTDIQLAEAIAKYFDEIGLLYWFDKRDLVIKERMSKGDSYDVALVHAIERGIRHSTDVLGVITPQVMGSWWVPYEIGAGRALGLKTAHLVANSVASASVPEYIRVSRVLWTGRDLSQWARSLLIGDDAGFQPESAALHEVETWIRQGQVQRARVPARKPKPTRPAKLQTSN